MRPYSIKSFFISSFFSILLLTSNYSSADELKNLDPEQIEALQNNGALIIDIRTAKEWQSTGIIPNSKKLQFFDAQGKFNAEEWVKELNQAKTSPDQPVVLVCRSGNRSSMVGNFLTQKLGMKKIYHLQNGISSWIKSGKKTIKDQQATNPPSK